MSNIKVVMTTVKYNEVQLDKLKELFHPCEFIHLDENDSEGIATALKKADVAILASAIDSRYLDAPNLKWIHCDYAGVDKFAVPELFKRNIFITSSAGRSSPALAEHAMFFMLALTCHSKLFYEAQKQHIWGVEGQESFKGLYGRTVGIIGMGHTGTELAIRLKACGMKVMGYRRRVTTAPQGVDVLYCSDRGDTLDEILKESDFIVLALPLTNRTYHLIGRREFELMKPSAFLINIARGVIIDEAELLIALKESKLAGAGLDTFETEPLPKDSSLWDCPNILITPHVTPQVPDRIGRSLSIISENVRRYRNGEELLNLITEEDIYTKL